MSASIRTFCRVGAWTALFLGLAPEARAEPPEDEEVEPPPATSPPARPPAPRPPPPAAPVLRRTLYVGGGMGMLLDIHRGTQNWRIQLVSPLRTWLSIEATTYGYHVLATGHHGDEDVFGLGLGTGLRFSAPSEDGFRPYAAVRLTHQHFFPDVWGSHGDGKNGNSHDHESVHRFGAALAVGFDAPLFEPTSRWRVGVDLEGHVLSGPGTNFGVASLFLLGYSL